MSSKQNRGYVDRLGFTPLMIIICFDNNNNNNKILLITNISNYVSFPPQIAYKLIEAGRSKDSLQIQGLSIDGLNNREYTTIQYRD